MNRFTRFTAADDADTLFSAYQDAETYVSFLAKQQGATRISIGTSYLGASIDGVQFGTGPENIFFHGGIHAREWISPASVTFMAYSLLTDAGALNLLDKYTFTILPVVNVDGYAYTRAKNGNRMWRKNRQPNPDSSCIGTDLNRNFDFKYYTIIFYNIDT